MASKKKLLTSAIALGTAAALTLGGTFAWQSISQGAVNEASDQINPGGRLHDDFDGTNKDIYVENFADDEIFARVRLKEYLEVIMNYGTKAEVVDVVIGQREDQGEVDGVPTFDRVGSVFNFKDRVSEDGTTVSAGTKNAEDTPLWKWTVGGGTLYMPTFDVNKDSLLADVNGIYEEGKVGTISNRFDPDDPQYTEYTDWSKYEDAEGTTGVGAKMTANAIYDADTNDIGELDKVEQVRDIIKNGAAAQSYKDFYDAGENDITKYIKLLEETHEVKATGDAKLISLTDWLALIQENGGKYDVEKHGGYWVYDDSEDEDNNPTGGGWVYWSSPIAAHSATGCLLNGIELTQVMDDTWYYSIEVQGQFVTANDIGKGDATGFYSTDDGPAPTENAEKLLDLIGVEMSAGGGQNPDEEEETLTLSDYSLTKNSGKLYFTTAITLGDQTITQPSKLTLKVYNPDGESAESMTASNDDDTLMSVVDGNKVRFDLSSWLDVIAKNSWDKLGFDVTYKSDDGDKTSEQVQLEIEDTRTLSAEIHAYYEDIASTGEAVLELSRMQFDGSDLTTSNKDDLSVKIYKQGETDEPIFTASGDDFSDNGYSTRELYLNMPQSMFREPSNSIDVYLTYSVDGGKARAEKTTVTFKRTSLELTEEGYEIQGHELFNGYAFLTVKGVDDPWKDMTSPDDVLEALTLTFNTYRGSVSEDDKVQQALTYVEESDTGSIKTYQCMFSTIYEKSDLMIFYTDSGVTDVCINSMVDWLNTGTKFELALGDKNYSVSFVRES